MAQVAAEGYTLSPDLSEESDGQFWCEITKATAVDARTIGKHTAALRIAAAQHGGEFDGWACPVVKGR